MGAACSPVGQRESPAPAGTLEAAPFVQSQSNICQSCNDARTDATLEKL